MAAALFLHGDAIKWRAGQVYGIRRVPKHHYPRPERKQEIVTSEEQTTKAYYREIHCAKKDGVWLPSSLTAMHHCLAHILSVLQVEAPFLVLFPQQSTLQGEEECSQLSFKAGVTLQRQRCRGLVCALLIYPAGCCPKYGFSPKTVSRLIN